MPALSVPVAADGAGPGAAQVEMMAATVHALLTRDSAALRAALGDKGAGLVNLHEGRRAREEMGYERYHALGYFEMGMQAIYDILVQKGVVTEQEVADRIAALKAASKEGL